MKMFLCFLCGAALILSFNVLHGSRPSHHVYELRMYHVHPGKMDALKAHFGDHTDAIFKRHNMKSIGYWIPEDASSSQKLFIYILEHPSRSGMEEGEGRVRGPRAAGRSYFIDPTSYSALN